MTAGPVSLSEADQVSTGSIPVTNPTTVDITVSAAPAGPGERENRCEVAVTKGSAVESGTSGSLSVSVATTDDCDNPADGAHQLVLLARSETPAAAPQVIVLSIAEATTGAADPKATGLELPDETVFLRRSGDDLIGSIDVLNTTSSAVIVTPSAVGKDCSVSPAAPPGAGVQIEPGGSTSISISVPAACNKLDSEALDLSVLMSTVDGGRYEYGTLSLEAEVDWSSVLRASKWILFAAFAAVVAGCSIGVWAFNRATSLPARKLRWADPVVAGADAPKSWLTAIATIGPVATALFSTSNLLEGLTGGDPTAPKTLVLVGTAVALALVALATMITTVPAVTVDVDGKKQDCPRIRHFALAAGLTTCSAGFALASVLAASTALNLPGGDDWVRIVGIVLAVALVAYAFWSVERFIERFAQLPPDAQAPAKPKAIPPELLAGALRSLAPNFIGFDRLTAIDPGDRRRWLAASKSAASEMLDLLTAGDATQAAAAASMAAQIAEDVSTTADVPEAEAQTARDAAAEAQAIAAEARAAADAGDDEQARELAEQASDQATESIDVTSRAAPDNADEAVSQSLADAEMLVTTFSRLATSPGDDYLAEPPQTSGRRPLTTFLI
ncbi:MAG: hypothetical protein GY798_17240 [Hyphomicrobiales bacterium]|nr:hypothetical protein [Hyphomicrobiales bacterium]